MDEFGETLEEMDVEAFMNMRDWLEKAITKAGGRVTDAGVGMGKADIGFTLLGMPYSVEIRPRLVKKPKAN